MKANKFLVLFILLFSLSVQIFSQSSNLNENKKVLLDDKQEAERKDKKTSFNDKRR